MFIKDLETSQVSSRPSKGFKIISFSSTWIVPTVSLIFNYNHFLEIYENTIDIERIKKIFNIEYDYIFVKFFLDNFNNVDFLYKEYYFYFLKKDYFNYSFLDMLNNNLLDNFYIFYEKYNNFNLEEYKISCGLKFNYDIQYYIQYIRDEELVRDE